MQHIASTFIAGLGCALFGWALVVISSRIERERQQRHADEFGEHMSPLTPVACVDSVCAFVAAPLATSRRKIDLSALWSTVPGGAKPAGDNRRGLPSVAMLE